MANFLIVTTPYIEGAKITSYRGIVNANQVVGVNVISDNIAAFSDFFGGMSGEYRGKLDTLRSQVEGMIIKEARKKGANAIIGFNLSFNEVSGKGKQMFMASAVGTAVEVDFSESSVQLEHSYDNAEIISHDEVKMMLDIQEILNLIEEDQNLSSDQKETLLLYPRPEWMEKLTLYYHKKYKRTASSSVSSPKIGITPDSYVKELLKFYFNYVSSLNSDFAASYLYPDLLTNNKESAVYAISQAKVLSFVELSKIIDKIPLDMTLSILLFNKKGYSASDYNSLKTIIAYFDNLPDLRVSGEYKTGLFKKEQSDIICQCGHGPLEEGQHCESCGKDMYGLSVRDRQTINKLKNLLKILDGYR